MLRQSPLEGHPIDARTRALKNLAAVFEKDPALGLAMLANAELARDFSVGVNLHAQAMARIDELDHQGKLAAGKAIADQRGATALNQLVQSPSGERPGRDDAHAARMICQLPRLADRAVGQYPTPSRHTSSAPHKGLIDGPKN